MWRNSLQDNFTKDEITLNYSWIFAVGARKGFTPRQRTQNSNLLVRCVEIALRKNYFYPFLQRALTTEFPVSPFHGDQSLPTPLYQNSPLLDLRLRLFSRRKACPPYHYPNLLYKISAAKRLWVRLPQLIEIKNQDTNVSRPQLQ